MNKLIVSIIVPCYNQAQYLDEALQSVFDQNYQNWECIIVNDGSPDNTEDIAKVWLHKDSRFRYIYKENGGLSSARNAGIEIANGEFILPLDADDKISKEYITLAIEEIKKDDSLKVVYCKAEKFGEAEGELTLPEFNLKLLATRNLLFCSAIYNKKSWIEVGGYDIAMIYGFEDWDFWIGILKNGGNIFKIDKVCFFYRIKKNSMFSDLRNNLNNKRLMLNYLSIKHVSFFVEHYGSFHEIADEVEKQKYDFESQLRSKKFIINVFCLKFFGFSIFRNLKKL